MCLKQREELLPQHVLAFDKVKRVDGKEVCGTPNKEEITATEAQGLHNPLG